MWKGTRTRMRYGIQSHIVLPLGSEVVLGSDIVIGTKIPRTISSLLSWNIA